MPETQPKAKPIFNAEDEYRPPPPAPPEIPAWKDGSLRIGIHTSIAGEISAALEKAHELGCNAVQIFTTSPRMWPRTGKHRGSESDDAVQRRIPEVEKFRARRAALGLGPVVIHANYLINLASPERVLRARSVQALHDELVRGVALGADYLVVHPGSARGMPRETALETVAQGLRQASRGFKHDGLRILLENTSGQGSSLGSRFEELRAILDAAADLPLGVCVDTAHTFEAGYAIHTEEGLARTLEEVERTVGLERMMVVHVNDSKTEFGSRVDRHEHIGKGRIGKEAFARILTNAKLSATQLPGRAFILETPIDRPGDDRRNVRMAWRLAGREAPRTGKGTGDGFKVKRKKEKGKRKKARKR